MVVVVMVLLVALVAVEIMMTMIVADVDTTCIYLIGEVAVKAACPTLLSYRDRLAGLVVKASASGADNQGFESRLRRDFSGIESYQ